METHVTLMEKHPKEREQQESKLVSLESVRSRKAGERGNVRRCQGTWGPVGLRRDSGFPPGWKRKVLSGSE